MFVLPVAFHTRREYNESHRTVSCASLVDLRLYETTLGGTIHITNRAIAFVYTKVLSFEIAYIVNTQGLQLVITRKKLCNLHNL